MKDLKYIFYTLILFFTFSPPLTAAPIVAQVKNKPTEVVLKVEFKNNQLLLTNTSNKPINLNNTIINFHFLGRVYSAIATEKNVKLNLIAKTEKSYDGQANNTYNLTIQDSFLLAPNKSVQLKLNTDNKDTPHDFKIKRFAQVSLQGTGTLDITLPASPIEGLTNPVITIEGAGTTRTKRVTWGTTWEVIKLMPGSYTVSAMPVSKGSQYYAFNSMTATISASEVTSKQLSYNLVPTSRVKVSLVNSPNTIETLILTGSNYTIRKNVRNGSALYLPADNYTVSSTESGYNTSYAPSPLHTPNDTALTVTYSPINQGNARTINFVNRCPFPVWFGFISGATPNPPGRACNSDADCNPGSTCVNRGAGGNQCFWKNPAPANNNFQLAANGGTNTVQIPIYSGLTAAWSGAIAGRTNCTGTGCETADCGGGTGACPAGRGFQQPATQAEITMNLNNPDFYDIELVNGMNIPVQMSPIVSGTPSNNPYNCGNPGAVTSSNSMGACSWKMNPPLVEYNRVRPGGNACTANSDCQAPNVCGLSFNPGKNPLLQKTCGAIIGYWNANQICGVQNNYGAPFNCNQHLPAPQQNLTITNLYQCTQVGSCYQDGAPSTCCGCENWDQLGIPVPNATYTKQCVNQNPNWLNYVLPTIEWMKKACPSAYTYPFDDMSSTFVCRINNSSNINSVNYTVTFCPGGATGGVTGS
ncbi:thaumatin family protein (plasmid) [Legionella sp. D16C41]|uniref:thaumatin family protein n=1 Tax=Legionella sp. D16C41 TaxID=3402688 RepID=UPI003AF4DE09